MSKKISLLVMICLIVSSISFTYADVVQEADVLHSVNLLKGDGDGFNLGGQLKRSEAATFIVKILGKENTVTKNKIKYISNAFEDVPSDAWYAPFVGYCHINGIVSGFEDGTFRPDDYVSEKAFLTMLLGAMGYQADVDFDWDTVLSKAYDAGLSNDISYAVRTEDNTSYIRGNVVHAMYNALSKPLNGQSKTLIERLVDNNVTNKVVAKKYGLLHEDELETKIEKATISSENTILLTLNEEVEGLVVNDLALKVDGIEHEVKSITQDYMDFTIKTDLYLYEGREYSIELKSVTDVNGHVVKDLRSTMKGIKREIVDSDEFLISYIQPVSNNMVEVYFTQPIDENALQPLFMKFGYAGGALSDGSFKNLSVKLLPETDKGLLLEFKEMTFAAGTDYEVFIRGDIQSIYKQYLDNGDGHSYVFSGLNYEKSSFEVTDADIIDDHFIEVEFNKATDKSSALDEDNYKLQDLENGLSLEPTKVYYYQDEESSYADKVVLRFTKLYEDRLYELIIDDVFDKYGSIRVERYEEEIEDGSFRDTDLEIVDVDAINRSMVEITFSEPLEENAENADIDISDGIRISDLYRDPNQTNKLIAYLSKSKYLDEDDEYELTVSNLEDYLGRDIEKNAKEAFDGESRSRDSIDILSAKYITEDMILVKLSEIGRKNDLEDLNRYELEYRYGTTKKVFYPSEIEIITLDEFIIKTDTSFADGDIRLYLKGIYDYSGQFKYSELSTDVTRLKK